MAALLSEDQEEFYQDDVDSDRSSADEDGYSSDEEVGLDLDQGRYDSFSG